MDLLHKTNMGEAKSISSPIANYLNFYQRYSLTQPYTDMLLGLLTMLLSQG